MYKFGSIVLIPFPFTDLTSTKLRPALIISKRRQEAEDVIVSFITSKKKEKLKSCEVRIKVEGKSFQETGLKVESTLRLDKIATLSKKLILGELGVLPTVVLKSLKKPFLEVFGF